MNKAYAFFCRAYQTVFRAALPILPYREPVQLDGLASIVPLLAEKKISSVLLVTDASVRALGLTGGLEDALKAASVACAVYDKTVPNPTIANIEEGRALYLSAHAQAIIAVGGGSVMDCAKVIGARVVKPRQSVQRMRGLLRVLKRTPLLIAVPTTAGTGSETTLAAVITDSAAHHKYPINDFALIPDYAVLDPELTRGLPPMLTATTGMDALTHAIEAYVSTANCDFTDPLAIHAIEMIMKDLVPSYNGDMAARDRMHNAQCLAGMAFSNALLGIVHSMAHKTGAAFADYGAHIIHGAANAMYLPKVIRFNSRTPEAKKRYADIARSLGLAGSHEEELVSSLIGRIEEMNSQLSIPSCIKDYEGGIISEEEFEEKLPSVARLAVEDACTLSNPRKINAGEMEELLRCCYYGTEVDF